MTERQRKRKTQRDKQLGAKGHTKAYRQSKSCQEMGELALPLASSSPLQCPPTPPHLGVGGSVDYLSLPQPDDGGSRLGIVCMAGEVEGVPSPQADHRPPEDHRVVRRHCGGRERGEVRLRAPLLSGKAEWILWSC